MNAVDLKQLQALIATGKTVLVNFWAPWCQPCKRMLPTLEELSAKHKGVTFVSVDTTKHPDAAGRYAALNVPCLLAFSGRYELERKSGIRSITAQQIESMLVRVGQHEHPL